MPCFRGINISVTTESDRKTLPEYPHPDGASVRLRNADENHDEGVLRQEPSLSSIGSGRSPVRLQKVNPKVSVYIPSLPGVKFWLEYTINRAPSPTCHLFFKMYMNGSHTTSWGINPRVKSNGTITRALYEPSNRWHYKEDGVLLKREGIESRSFHFASNPEERSVAEEGGTIEIQVFRSHGKRRRAAKLDQFRNQEKYGITAPSGGLLDTPEDAIFYDFHLIDAKDSPYATFRFHYRSWENLRQLSLIPAEACDIISEEYNTILEDGQTVQRRQPMQDFDETYFIDDDLNLDSIGAEKDVHYNEQENGNSHILKGPPELRPTSPSNERIPQPSKALRDCPLDTYLQRPLPELPRVPDGQSSAMFSRKLSTDSRAPSITPSLLPFVEDEAFMDESVEVGQATELVLPSNSDPSVRPLEQDHSVHPMDDISSSDYEASIASTAETKNPSMLSPGNYLASSGSALERSLALLATPQSLQRSSRGSLSPKINKSLGQEVVNPDISTYEPCTLSESEWMRRTPSPSHFGLPSTQSSKTWSPQPSRKSKGSLFGSLGRIKSRSRSRSRSKSPNKINQMEDSHRDSSPLLGRHAFEELGGNWI